MILNVYDTIKVCFTNVLYQYINTFVHGIVLSNKRIKNLLPLLRLIIMLAVLFHSIANHIEKQ